MVGIVGVIVVVVKFVVVDEMVGLKIVLDVSLWVPFDTLFVFGIGVRFCCCVGCCFGDVLVVVSLELMLGCV